MYYLGQQEIRFPNKDMFLMSMKIQRKCVLARSHFFNQGNQQTLYHLQGNNLRNSFKNHIEFSMMFTMKKTVALLAIAASVSTSASAFIPSSTGVATFGNAAAAKTLPVAR